MQDPRSPSPDDELANARGLKVHLSEVPIGRDVYRVVRLRAATTARFSTNYFHDTWHILTDGEGAFVLARLLWGLAFQRQPGTLVLLDRDHIVPTPFEADPPLPIVLASTALASPDATALQLLRARLRRPAPSRTVRWQTFGLPAALETTEHRGCREEGRQQRSQERMSRRGGFVCYAAPPDLLRANALSIYRMRACKSMSYHYLAEDSGAGWWRTDGEVQVFRDFRDKVSAATVARRCVSPTRPADVPVADDRERDAIYREAGRAGGRLRAGRARDPASTTKSERG